MRTALLLTATLTLAPIPTLVAAEKQPTGGTHGHTAAHATPYTGQEHRAIKSLSDQDIDDLRNGRGWGLAKAAELNGMPGPSHVLEMKNELALTASQVATVEAMFAGMRAQAIPLGEKLIGLEDALNQAFARRKIDAASLKTRLDEISRLRSQLRYVHLATHLATPDVLTHQQIADYNRLRGYGKGRHTPSHK